MSAILLTDTDILRLGAQVNVQRAAGLIPTGGLLVNKGTYFQLMVTGESTVTYTIVMEASDVAFQTKANILSGLGAFALGTPQYVNGYWVQAFGDMAGSGGGGGSSLPDGTVDGQTIQWSDAGSEWLPGVIPANGEVYGQDDALGADLPTIFASADAGFPLGIVVIDATGQTSAGMFILDGTTPLTQITASTATGLGITGPAGTGNVTVNTAGVSLNTENGSAVQAGVSGITVTHPSGGGNVLASAGTDISGSTMSLRRPYATAANVSSANTSATFQHNVNNGLICNNTGVLVNAAISQYQFAAAAFYPVTASTRNLGQSANQWNNSYFAVASTIGSDERIKTAPQAIPDAVLDAVGDIDIVQYKLLAAIALKGEPAARLHVGVIAQQVVEAFAARGLDATDYGVLCFDEWDAAPAVLDDDGNVITPAREAGEMYSIRYDELLVLEAARVRRELSRLSS